MPRLAIIGGSGLLGRHLVGALDEGWTATSLDPAPFPDGWATPDGFRGLVGNAFDDNSLADALEGADAVWIKAAKLAGDRLDDDALPAYERLNVELPARVLAAADRAGVRRVLLDSSDAVFLETWAPGRHLPESRPCPKDHYGRTKAAAEGLMRESAAGGRERSAQVLRYTRVRWRESGGVLALWCLQARLGLPIRVFGDGSRGGCVVHVSDATSAARAALDGTPSLAFYNLTLPHTTLGALAEKVSAAHGGGVRIARAADPSHPDDPEIHAMDAADSWERLGVAPLVSVSDMVAETSAFVAESLQEAVPSLLKPLRGVPGVGALVRMTTVAALRRRGIPL